VINGIRMPGANGMAVLTETRRVQPDTDYPGRGWDPILRCLGAGNPPTLPKEDVRRAVSIFVTKYFQR
jgi:hypothetical protein